MYMIMGFDVDFFKIQLYYAEKYYDAAITVQKTVAFEMFGIFLLH